LVRSHTSHFTTRLMRHRVLQTPCTNLRHRTHHITPCLAPLCIDPATHRSTYNTARAILTNPAPRTYSPNIPLHTLAPTPPIFVHPCWPVVPTPNGNKRPRNSAARDPPQRPPHRPPSPCWHLRLRVVTRRFARLRSDACGGLPSAGPSRRSRPAPHRGTRRSLYTATCSYPRARRASSWRKRYRRPGGARRKMAGVMIVRRDSDFVAHGEELCW
jgi:hypothetical protein